MPSFDIVSKVDWHEIDNAINQANKEVSQRFDFKNAQAELEKVTEGIVIRASSEDRTKAAYEVLRDKMVKRKVSLKHLDPGKHEATGKGGSKIMVKIVEGIDHDHARELLKWIKDEKMKVQASILDGQLRVTGKKRDDLQECIALLRGKDFDIELQFVNFRD